MHKIMLYFCLCLLYTSSQVHAKKKTPTPKKKTSAFFQSGGGFKADKIIQYKKVPQRDRPLELHFFYPPDFKASEPHATVLFFFGGGW